MGSIISVFTNKGGVAKTTTTLSLAHALAKMNIKILVMDVDSQCNTSEPLIGIDPANSLLDVLTEKATIEECIRPLEFQNNLYCLPNTSDLVGLEPTLIKKGIEGFFVLKKKIKKYCLHNFDITIIDCPPNHGIMTINALMTSDLAIVPTEAGSRNSIKGLKSALTFIDDIKADGNSDLKFLKLLITKLDSRTAIGKDYVSQLNTIFSGKIFNTNVPKNVDFQYAENQNQTIFQSNPKASGAKAYTKIANEIVQLLGL
ncbi:MAG: ParA family protein [Bacteroidales bacterium]|nr:ParA family protein [Bacteroidales bacterium]